MEDTQQEEEEEETTSRRKDLSTSTLVSPGQLINVHQTSNGEIIQAVRNSRGEPWYLLVDIIRCARLKVNTTNASKRLFNKDCKKREIQLPTGGTNHVWTVSRLGVIHLLVGTKAKNPSLNELIEWTRTFVSLKTTIILEQTQDRPCRVKQGNQIIAIELTKESNGKAQEIYDKLIQHRVLNQEDFEQVSIHRQYLMVPEETDEHDELDDSEGSEEFIENEQDIPIYSTTTTSLVVQDTSSFAAKSNE